MAKPKCFSPFLLIHRKLGSKFPSLLTPDPMETAGPAEPALCFQAGLEASAAVPGPVPYLNGRAWQAHRLRV